MNALKRMLAIVMIAAISVVYMPILPGINGTASATDNYYAYTYPNNNSTGNCAECACNLFLCKEIHSGHWDNNETVHSWVCDKGTCRTGNHDENGPDGCCSVCGYKGQHAISYIDADGTTKTCTDYTEVTASATGASWTNGNTYVVEKDVTISNTSGSGVNFGGDVKLILCDGATLTVNGNNCGLFGSGVGYNLTVYAGSTGSTVSGTGKLVCNGGTGQGMSIGNTLTVNGGIVESTGGEGLTGIFVGETLILNGGYVKAQGGDGVYAGNGISTSFNFTSYKYNPIRINGGTLIAIGGIGNELNGLGLSAIGDVYVYTGAVVKMGNADSTPTVYNYKSSPIAGSDLSGFYVSISKPDTISYIDADGTTKTCTDYTEVTASTTGASWTNGNTYVVKEDVTISNSSGTGIALGGDVKLIICDGATLTLNGSTYGVFGQGVGDKLTVYAGSSSTTVSGTGKLVSNGGSSNGMFIGSSLTVNGGSVESNGGKDNQQGQTGIFAPYVTINGGYLKAKGQSGGYGGAGITNNSNAITINGGSLIAIGGGGLVGKGLSVGSVSVYTNAVVKNGADASTATVVQHTGTIQGSSLSGFYVSITEPEPVAQIGETKYDTVQEAVTAAKTGETVKLLSDVDLTATLEVVSGKNFTLDLNGKTLDAKNIPTPAAAGDRASVIYINSGATLTLDDSSTGTPGKITGGKGTAVNKTLIRGGGVYNAGTLNIKKVSITKNVAKNGAGVFSADPSILNMYSGEISDNEASSGGGGVYNFGTFTLEGGNIKNNTANGNGGAVYASAEGTFTMTGGTISKNKSTFTWKEQLRDAGAVSLYGSFVMDNGSITENIGGGVLFQSNESATTEVSGAAKVTGNTSAIDGSASNLKIASGKTITIGTAGLKEGASIGVTTLATPTATAGVAFTSNGTADDLKYFTSDNQAYKLKYVAATEGETPVAAHLELVNYDLNAMASNTTSITLDNDVMTKEQAIAIAKAQKPYSALSKKTFIVYAKADNFDTDHKYKTIMATNEEDWKEVTYGMTLDTMKGSLSANEFYVIGTVTNHSHSFTSYAEDTSKKTITATCSNDDCGLKDSKITVKLVAEDKEYTGEAYAGASIDGKKAWEDAGAATLSLKYKGRGDTSYAESDTAPTNVGTYTVTMTADGKSVSADFEITKKQLSISTEEGKKTTVKSSKTYDGGKTATVTNNGTLTGVIEGTTVLLDTVTAEYEDKNVGTSKKVTVKYTITGTDAKNYKAPADNDSFTASIEAKEISVSGTSVEDKTYDGNTTATVNKGNLVDVIQGDAVTLSATGEFKDKSAGDDKDVTVTYSISGTDADNYTLADYSETLNASIYKKDVSVSTETGKKTTVADKTYNGKKDATVTAGELVGVISGDNVILGASGEFDNKNVDEDKDVNITYSISGKDADNYNLTTTSDTLQANITAKQIEVTGTTVKSSKTYDGGKTATVTADGKLTGVIEEDDVSIGTVTAEYADKNAETGKKVTVSYSLKGDDKDNYTVKNTELTADITAKQLTISGTKVTGKTYDGTTAATATVGNLTNKEAGDKVKVAVKSAVFADANAEENKTVTVKYSISGEDADNYIAPVDDNSFKATISKKQLTISTDAGKKTKVEGKTYDGNADASKQTTAGTLVGVVGTDDVKVAISSSTYANANAGENKTVTVKYSISGKQAGNYLAPVDDNSFKATISKKQLTISTETGKKTVVSSKTYDGNDTAEVTAGTLVGVVSEDVVKVAATGTFEDILAGKNKSVAVSYTISGTDAANYLAPVDETLKADIDKIETVITITANSKSKVYDGKELTDTGYSYTEDVLLDGDKLSAVVEGSITNVGSSTNKVVSHNVMRGTVDVTDCYTIEYVYGELEITPDPKADTKVDTEALKEILKKHKNDGDKVAVEMRTDGKVTKEDKEPFKPFIGNKKAVYMDAQLILTVDGDEQNIGGDNDVLVGITYKFDFTGKKDIQVFRNHAGDVEELTTAGNSDKERVEFNKDKGTITIYASKYSTYAIAYNEVKSTNTADSNDIAPWALLMLMSVMGLAGYGLKRKNN